MHTHTYILSVVIIETHGNTPKIFGRNKPKKNYNKTTTTSQKRNFYHNQTQIQINERENAITTHVDSVTKTTTTNIITKLQCQTKYWVAG